MTSHRAFSKALAGIFFALILIVFIGQLVAQDQNKAIKTNRNLVVVVGAPGADEFESQFSKWADQWKSAAETAGISCTVLNAMESSDSSQSKLLQTEIERIAALKPSEFWLILIGHGTFDGKIAKFNLVGPDCSSNDLKQMLAQIPKETATIVINCASCSGAFIGPLTNANRTVITSTKNGSEMNFSRFGEFMALSVSDVTADLDKDGQVSLLEAFLTASKQTQRFYENESRLATEHALIDDNGDGQGTAADWFQGIRVVGAARDGRQPDGPRANQMFLSPDRNGKILSDEIRQKCSALELGIEALIRKKGTFSEDDYYRQLEVLFVELAELYGKDN